MRSLAPPKALPFLVLLLFALLAAAPAPGAEPPPADGDRRAIRIGVLAKRGYHQAMDKWGPTARYLHKKLPEHAFDIHPLDFDELHPAVEAGSVDFILTNSSLYVELEARYGASRLCTLVNRNGEEGQTSFGGVIFTRADRGDLRTLDDLRGKSFMAVDRKSFGGFQTAWRELLEKGIRIEKDFARFETGGTHDAVVLAVAAGEVDAGTVRTDTLERMAAERKIVLEAFKALNPKVVPGFPYLLSTRLYPEWPLARLHHVPNRLARRVAQALLQMEPESPAAVAASITGWTIPLNYQPVHDCLKTLRIGPYRDLGKVTLGQAARQYWYIFAAGALLAALGAGFTLVLLRLNRRLSASRRELEAARRDLEVRVAERTRDLRESNEDLTREVVRHKETAKALNKSEERLRAIFNNSSIGISIVDLDGRYLQANPALADMLGCPPEEVLNLTIGGVTHPDDREGSHGWLKKIVQGETDSYRLEKRYLRQDGRVLWGEFSANPIKNEQGDIEAVISIISDIDDRKRAEVEIKRSLEEAEDSRDKIDNILRSISSGLVVTDTANRVILMNEKAETFLGVSFAALRGLPLGRLEDCASFHPGLRDYLAAPTAEGEITDFTLSEGGPRIIAARSSLMRDPRGKTTGTVTILQDVTRERELDRLKSEFISTAAHELNTPLTSILGYAELLLNQEGFFNFDRTQQDEFLAEIYDKGEALARTIDDLLDISRIEAGKLIPLDLHPCDLGEIIEKTVRHLQLQAPRHHISYTLPPEGQSTLSIDRHRMTQVLENLISNAVKYSPRGGTIRIEAERLGERYRVSVADEGLGMTPAQVERVFDKFYRVDASDTAVSGLGLGMSIVKQTIEGHEGSIRVESTLGIGTTVVFELPAAP